LILTKSNLDYFHKNGLDNGQLTGKDVVDGVRFIFVLRDFGDTLKNISKIAWMSIFKLTVHHYLER